MISTLSLHDALPISGQRHSAALLESGSVIAWGTDVDGSTVVPEDLTNVIALAAGSFHNLALRVDGTGVGWGSDFFAQASPPSGLNNVVSFAEGSHHTLSCRYDRSV